MPTTDSPESRLDRVARDLSRTLLHGARPKDSAGKVRPSTIVTGQQIPVDVPSSGDMDFAFAAGGAPTTLTVPRDKVLATKAIVDSLNTDQGKAAYLTLSADADIPTWVFQQRQFSVAPTAPEDTVNLSIPNPAPPPTAMALTVVKLPGAAIEEVDPTGSLISLLVYDTNSKQLTEVPRANWQPAIVLRFPLKKSTPPPGLPAGMQIFELVGTPEGDRWFLDQLGLLPGSGTTNAPDVAGISLILEAKNNTQATIPEWTIARSNLTREGRANTTMGIVPLDAPAAATFPYIAVSGVGPDQDKDALRLLEMASITNSGGYFLRATSDQADTQTLVLVVLLKPVADTTAGNKESGALPTAANSLALLAGTTVNSVRFNGMGHIEVSPFSAPGTLSFGWTRTEPQLLTQPVDKFGFGTISLVEYSAQDATGQAVPLNGAIPVISPTNQLPGDHYARLRPSGIDGAGGGVHNLHTGDSAAMRLAASAPVGTAPISPDAGDTPVTVVKYYRARLACFSPGESPWKRLSDPRQSQITFTPDFRDVFGNRLDAASAAPVLRRLFYTDALISPSEWPGVRFIVYPITQGGKAYLGVEMSYRYLDPKKDSPDSKKSRLTRLAQIRMQLQGAGGDVAITLSAFPLLKTVAPLSTNAITQQLLTWSNLEAHNSTEQPAPLVMPLGPIACDGQVSDLTLFQPTIVITRTKSDYLPHSTDLPEDPVLANLISSQITIAGGTVILQASGTLAPATDPTKERQDEFLPIAVAFNSVLSGPFSAQVGFLRDQRNQHELWLIPNSFFPSAPDSTTYAGWSFATARPLSNSLGNESFQVPDFTGKSTSPQHWGVYPLVGQTVVDQDFDKLGRVALQAIENQSADLGLLTLPANGPLMRSLLTSREKIANQLAGFGSVGSWLVPLFAAPGDIDGAAAGRVAQDAFLANLNAFYAVSTIVQLPLNPFVNPGKLKFEGSVTPAFTADPAGKLPTFSDVLLHDGEKKITILYDLPPNLTDYQNAPIIDSLVIAFSHVQRALPNPPADPDSFNVGQWLELAQPFPLKWKGPASPLPVADRTFPTKPVIQSARTILPWLRRSRKIAHLCSVRVTHLKNRILV